MSTRFAFTPVVGLFTGLSMVSFGAVSMLLTGVHGSPSRAVNPCTSSSTTAFVKRSAPADLRGGARARLTRRNIVLLDAASRILVTGQASHHSATRLAGSPASGNVPAGTPAPQHTSSPPSPPNPSLSPAPIKTPSPKPSNSSSTPPVPQPGSTEAVPAHSHGSSPPVTPGGPLQSPTPSATPTPTATTTPPPAAHLCVTVQTLGGTSAVDPGSKVRYAIWVWLTSGTGGSAKIALDASPNRVAPTFSVCQPPGGSTCSVGGLTGGQHVEVQAELATTGLAGRDVTLTATATSKDATNSASASATIRVRSDSSTNSSSPTPNSGNAGNGGTLPAAGLPGGGGNGIPGLPNPSGNLGTAFPQVSPSPGHSAAKSHGRHPVNIIDLSAGLPLDVRLVGGQLIGLAVLAAAVTIAVARLSLRRQPPRHSDEGGSSSAAPPPDTSDPAPDPSGS